MVRLLSKSVGLDIKILILSIVKIILRTFGPHSSTFTTLSGCFTILRNVLQPDDKFRIVPKPYLFLCSSLIFSFLPSIIIKLFYKYPLISSIQLLSSLSNSFMNFPKLLLPVTESSESKSFTRRLISL